MPDDIAGPGAPTAAEQLAALISTDPTLAEFLLGVAQMHQAVLTAKLLPLRPLMDTLKMMEVVPASYVPPGIQPLAFVSPAATVPLQRQPAARVGVTAPESSHRRRHTSVLHDLIHATLLGAKASMSVDDIKAKHPTVRKPSIQLALNKLVVEGHVLEVTTGRYMSIRNTPASGDTPPGGGRGLFPDSSES